MMQTAENWFRSENFVVRKTVSVSSPRYRFRAGFRQARTQAAVRTASIVVPGKPLTKLNNSHNKVRAATGLRFVIYDFRHTFATRLAEAGADAYTIAEILGHSNINMVRRYVHITRSHQKEAMRRFEATAPKLFAEESDQPN